MNDYMTPMELAEKDLYIAKRELANAEAEKVRRVYGNNPQIEKDIKYWTNRITNIEKRMIRINREEDRLYER